MIISIASPLLVGLYKEGLLIETFSSEKKTSEVLLPYLLDILDTYALSRIIYTRSPGSYMAIKLTYIMLKTIEITRGIPCVGCSGFALNGAKPIKAIGSLYFIKEKETIITKKFEQPLKSDFRLPQYIDSVIIDKSATPEYILPAV